MIDYRLHNGDALEMLSELDDQSVQCCVTSPPYYGLRDYGVEGQMGLEASPRIYIENMVAVFEEVRRVLRDDGTCWINIGDSYAGGGRGGNMGLSVRDEMISRVPRTSGGLADKQLLGMPWRLAFALQDEGWFLRSAIVWAKPNGMPGSQTDRCTTSYEMIFQLSKSEHYFSDFDAIKTPPRESSMIRTAQNLQLQMGSHRANGGEKSNGTMKAMGCRTDKQRGHSRKHAGFNERWDLMSIEEQQSKPATMRDVWFVSPACSSESHFAVMPNEIAKRCILAGSREGDVVLDPFAGSGTTLEVAVEMGRKAVGIELNPEYCNLIEKRMNGLSGNLFPEGLAV